MKLGPSFPPVVMLEAGLAGTGDALAGCTLENTHLCSAQKSRALRATIPRLQWV